MKIKSCCQKWGDMGFIFWLLKCKRYSKVRKICIDSGRLARSTCPTVQMRLVRYHELPSGYCNIKHPQPWVVMATAKGEEMLKEFVKEEGLTMEEAMDGASYRIKEKGSEG